MGEFYPKSKITVAQMEMLRKIYDMGGTIPVDFTKPFTVGSLVRKGLIKGDLQGRIALTEKGRRALK